MTRRFIYLTVILLTISDAARAQPSAVLGHALAPSGTDTRRNLTTVTGQSLPNADNSNSIVVVDGIKFTTVQAAINALPGTGGVVFVPPGTWTGPTSMPNNIRIYGFTGLLPIATWNTNSGNHLSIYTGSGSDQPVIFTYTSGLTLNNLFNTEIRNVIFDFGGNNSGLTLISSVANEFEIGIQNCGTGTALTLGTNAAGATAGNTALNRFPRLYIANCNKGIVLSPNSGSGYVTNNHFGFIFMDNLVTSAIETAHNCDSNRFDFVQISGLSDSANGVIINTLNPSADVDAGGQHFGNLQVDPMNPHTYTGTALMINNSQHVVIDDFVNSLARGHGTALTVNANASYVIGSFSDFSGTNRDGLEAPGFNATGPLGGSNGYLLSDHRIVKWSLYRGLSDEFELDDLASPDSSKHRITIANQGNTDIASKGTSAVRINALPSSGTGGCVAYSGGTSPIVVGSCETLRASLATTAATSDNVTVTGMTPSGHCSLTATNASAAANIATTYISAKTMNQVTVTHTPTGGMSFDILCTQN